MSLSAKILESCEELLLSSRPFGPEIGPQGGVCLSAFNLMHRKKQPITLHQPLLLVELPLREVERPQFLDRGIRHWRQLLQFGDAFIEFVDIFLQVEDAPMQHVDDGIHRVADFMDGRRAAARHQGEES